MGLVKILQNKGDGLYSVEVSKDLAVAKKRIEALTAQIQKLNDEIAELNPKIAELQAQLNAKLAIVDDVRQQMLEREVLLQLAVDLLAVKQSNLSSQQQNLSSTNGQLDQAILDRDAVQADIDSGNFTGQDLIDLQDQLAALISLVGLLEAQRDAIEAQIDVLNDEIRKLERDIEDYQDLAKMVKKIEEAVGEATKVAQELEPKQKQVLINQAIIEKKESIKADYESVVNTPDVRDAWCIDYEVDLQPGDTERVSVEVNDDPERQTNNIKIAAHTYTPEQSDVDRKDAVYQAKLLEKQEYEQKAVDESAKANEVALQITDVEAEITERSLVIATLMQVNEDGFYTTQIENLRAEVDALNERVVELLRRKAAHERLALKYNGTADALTAGINRLASEILAYQQAMQSASGIYTPKKEAWSRQVQPTHSSSPEAVFFNLALLPGYQKWKPTFRRAKILLVKDNDLCDVELYPAQSSQQNLNINHVSPTVGLILYDVPVKYGDCNSAAFNNNDDVLVEFLEQDKNKPCVVGFLSNPKPCSVLKAVVNNGAKKRVWRDGDYQPDGTPINNTSNLKDGGFGVGGDYWISDDLKFALSWQSNKIYYRGKSLQLPTGGHFSLPVKGAGLISRASQNIVVLAAFYKNHVGNSQTDEIHIKKITFSLDSQGNYAYQSHTDELTESVLITVSLAESNTYTFFSDMFVAPDSSYFLMLYQYLNFGVIELKSYYEIGMGFELYKYPISNTGVIGAKSLLHKSMCPYITGYRLPLYKHGAGSEPDLVPPGQIPNNDNMWQVNISDTQETIVGTQVPENGIVYNVVKIDNHQLFQYSDVWNFAELGLGINMVNRPFIWGNKFYFAGLKNETLSPHYRYESFATFYSVRISNPQQSGTPNTNTGQQPGSSSSSIHGYGRRMKAKADLYSAVIDLVTGSASSDLIKNYPYNHLYDFEFDEPLLNSLPPTVSRFNVGETSYYKEQFDTMLYYNGYFNIAVMGETIVNKPDGFSAPAGTHRTEWALSAGGQVYSLLVEHPQDGSRVNLNLIDRKGIVSYSNHGLSKSHLVISAFDYYTMSTNAFVTKYILNTIVLGIDFDTGNVGSVKIINDYTKDVAQVNLDSNKTATIMSVTS